MLIVSATFPKGLGLHPRAHTDAKQRTSGAFISLNP